MPLFVVLIGVLTNNARLTDANTQISEQGQALGKRIDDLNKRFDDVRTDLKADLAEILQAVKSSRG